MPNSTSLGSRPNPPPAAAGGAFLRHASAEVRAGYDRWRAGGDSAAAEAVVLAVVREHIPDKARRMGFVPDDGLALVADLGFDSMAIAEMVFTFEDIFEVAISNAEILPLRTVGDLRAFVRRRLALRP